MPLESIMAPPRCGRVAWGGPKFEWVDPLNLRAPSFVLDDTAEAKEWQGVERRFRGKACDMGSALGALEAARDPILV